MRLAYLLAVISAMVMLGSTQAYYNITSINTSVILYPNTSAHVVETFTLFVSNSSTQQYIQNRNAVGISLSDWQNIIYTTELTQHIVNSKHSTYGFTFLPGPLSLQYNGGTALLTMSYYINNVTYVKNIAPRKFEYTFNNTVFNFENTANGQALPANTRLNIIIPSGAHLTTVYPLPDLPAPTFINNYSNFTSFSWFSGEPLSQFSFSFLMTQSLQAEVVSYFSGVYNNYTVALYLAFVIIVVFVFIYAYLRPSKTHANEK